MAFPTYGRRKEMKVLDHRTAPSPWAVPEPTETAPDDPVIETEAIELTDAERARTIAQSTRIAVLNVYNSNEAPPSGFAIPFCSASNGTPLCAIPSTWLMSGAVKDMARVSLTLAETPLTAAEASLHTGMSFRGMLRYASDGGALESRIAEFSLAQPKVGGLIESGQSRLCFIATEVITVSDAYGVRDVDCREYLAAAVDPLSEIAPTLVNYLVLEHGQSLAMLCNAFGEATNAIDARLVSVDHLGLDILATLSDNSTESVRVGFSKPVFTSEEVRAELGILVRAAAFKQG